MSLEFYNFVYMRKSLERDKPYSSRNIKYIRKLESLTCTSWHRVTHYDKIKKRNRVKVFHLRLILLYFSVIRFL